MTNLPSTTESNTSEAAAIAARIGGGRRRPRRRRGAMRWVILLLMSCGLIAGVLWGTVWWEERPLAEVEELLKSGEPHKALMLADRFLRDFPEHGRATALKARAYLMLGDADQAARLFDRVGAATAEDMRDCARAYLLQERWVEALPVLEYLLQQKPDDADLLHETAACRARLGRYDQAVDAATKFAGLSGFEARGYLLIGTIESERGNDGKACSAWARVRELRPEGTDLQVTPAEFFGQYGTALLESGQAAAAVEVLKNSLELQDSAEVRATLGKAAMQIGQDSEAELQWRKVLAMSSENEQARQGLAELAMRKSDFQRALELLEPLSDSPGLSMSSAFLLQRAYTMGGQTEKSAMWKSRLEEIRRRDELANTVDQVLIESANTTWGQALRAYRFAEQGNWAQAEILLSPLLSEKKVHPFLVALGIAIRDRGALPDLNGIPLELF